ncbi:DUF6138 family protein [Flavobacterium chilense]|uniref:Uncharacterized protein n=1 Tax=Flavobacterium chilense TaxID=946677 RepID=A0A1M7F0V6_9FLAO|nr:DUF6138 family protein [Flavobacterium chilense]SHL97593.1 hypothetical protein SAMN05444484_103172 [Flavobacterium chilense]
MRELNYLVKIEGNEALLERFIDAINEGTIKIDKAYPEPYLLHTGEKFLLDPIVKYFFQTRPFSKELYISFVEKLRQLNGFRSYEYALGNLTKDLICSKIERVKKNNSRIFVPKTGENLPQPILAEEENELLSFLCYLAVSHIKYGPSYASVTANQYFDVVTALGSDEVEKLKKNGTGKLSKELTGYKDSDFIGKANDVFATINIKLTNETEESYKKALVFVNNLLKSDFPKSYEIAFSSKNKELLPVKGLPKCGQNYLFAGAVKYPNLHQEILEYISLARQKYAWYTNLEDENCAMPSTFAVFALGLESETYFETLISYYQTIDEEHQSIQQKFTPVFLEKFGVTEKSIKVYINAILSLQEHPHNKAFIPYFITQNSLNLLLDSKENFSAYYFTEEHLKEFSNGETEVQEMADYYWESVMYTIFGQSKDFNKIVKQLNNEEKVLFEKLQIQEQ